MLSTQLCLGDSSRKLLQKRADALETEVRSLLDDIVRQPVLPVDLLTQIEGKVKKACDVANAEHSAHMGAHAHFYLPHEPGPVRMRQVKDHIDYVVAAAKEAKASADPQAAVKLHQEVKMWAIACTTTSDILIAPSFLKLTQVRADNAKGRLRRRLEAAAKETNVERVTDARNAANSAIKVDQATDIALGMTSGRYPIESPTLARLKGIRKSLETAVTVVTDCPKDASVIAEVQSMLRLAVTQLDGNPCVCRDNDGFAEMLKARGK
jgi:hypothetical protein